jgi:ribonuclease P protein component
VAPPQTPPGLDPAIFGRARFTKAERLRRRAEYQRVRAQGQTLSTRHFRVTLAPGEHAWPRLGLVATRRLGPAVKRNRVKRLLREFFRRHKTRLPAADLVIMAKTGAAELTYQQVHDELSRLLDRRP